MLRNLFAYCVLCAVILTGCTTTTPQTTPQPEIWGTLPPTQPVIFEPTGTFEADTPEAAATSLPRPTAAPGVNPLTGLQAEGGRLERRPVIVKVENLPRNNRPQWGLNEADHVYEYYTEQGTTRFAAIFYGNDAQKVAPIRSARWFDLQLVQMYKSFFVFGSAYSDLLKALFESDFSDYLLIETPDTCPALCRSDPNGRNVLMADTAAVHDYMQSLGVDDAAQDLSGFAFADQAPEGGEAVGQVFVRFSGAIYNRWDYNAETGRYERHADRADDLSGQNEQYDPLLDRNTEEIIQTDNLVVLVAEYHPVVITDSSEVYDIPLIGKGWAFAFRDGQLYNLDWVRERPEDLVHLTWPDGSTYPLKPGRTWFEVINRSSNWQRQEDAWRFTFRLP